MINGFGRKILNLRISDGSSFQSCCVVWHIILVGQIAASTDWGTGKGKIFDDRAYNEVSGW